MSYWDTYNERINLDGNTQRDRVINRFKSQLQRKAPSNPSYKTIKLNGEETYLVINSGTQKYYKEFESMPGQDINIGDYVEWANSYWLVTGCDSDDEIYKDGKLEQCNWLLKWQNEKGEIIERWAVIMSASKYNDGTDSNNVIALGSDQLSVQIPVDEESMKLKKSMSKKFFIDCFSADPTAYELTGTGNVVNTYNGHGVTAWIVKECAYTPTEDDLKYGVCNYHSPATPPEPTDPPETDETAVLSASITGNTELKLGLPRTYTVTFTDENDMEVTDVEFEWNVVADFDVEQIIEGNTVELYVEDDSLIGESFLLQVIVGDSVVAEIEITVVDTM